MLRVCLGVVVGLVVLSAAASAEAQPAAPAQAAMEEYFDGEKNGGLVLVAMGSGGLIAGGLLYRSSSRTARGASYPLLGVGLVHVAAGIFVWVASDNRIDDFTAQIADDPAAFVTAERARMKGVSTQLTVLKVVEVVLIAGGLTMAAVGHRSERPRLKGAGLALALEAVLTLGFDFVAARRAGDYRDRLATIDVAAGIDPVSGAPTAWIVHGGEF